MKQSTLLESFTKKTTSLAAHPEEVNSSKSAYAREANFVADGSDQVPVQHEKASLIHPDISATDTTGESGLNKPEAKFTDNINTPKVSEDVLLGKKPSIKSLSLKSNERKQTKQPVSLNSVKHAEKDSAKSCSNISTDYAALILQDEMAPEITQKKSTIGYGEFLAQIELQSKPEIRVTEISASEPEPVVLVQKPVMSYTEFLGMFKSPPAGVNSGATEDGGVEGESSTKETAGVGIKCKSIASFFNKVEQGSGRRTINGSHTETRQACDPSLEGSKEKGKAEVEQCTIAARNKSHPNASKVAENNNTDGEVEFVSSKKISNAEEVDDKGDLNLERTSSMKRKNAESPGTRFLNIKKQKVVTQSEQADCQSRKEVDIKHEVNQDEMLKTAVPTSSKGTTREAISAVSSSPVLLSPTAAASKSIQSTLCFGKAGLTVAVTTVVESKADALVNEDTSNAGQLPDKKSKRNASLVKCKIDSVNESLGGSFTVWETESPLTPRKASFRHRQEVGSSVADTVIESSKQCDPTRKSEPVTEESLELVSVSATEENLQSVSDSSPGPRRSARLTQKAQCVTAKVAEADVLEILSDTEDDDFEDGLKKKNYKKCMSKVTSAKGEQVESSKKQSGKLAPIFMFGKSKELPGKVIVPQLDPEQERLKREFLMSGIPEELKRQIATAAATDVVLDYPPYPSISHVQQLQETSLASAKSRLPAMRCWLENEVDVSSLSWESFWKKYAGPVKEAQNFPFENFIGHPQLETGQVDVLLRDLESKDARFPFRRMYSCLQNRARQAASSEATTAGAASTPKCDVLSVEENTDDVIIVEEAAVPVITLDDEDEDETMVTSQQKLPKQNMEPKACLWTELHQPDSSHYIVGNSGAVKQLRKWLAEWKLNVEKQEYKANRKCSRSSKNTVKGGWSGGSDFTDSEEEESSLCNTVLLTGPHGMGKTSSVYALAKELDYKVFEVNSSSHRSGKQLLAQLEEATQSHRVSQNKSLLTANLGSSIKEVSCEEKGSKNISKAKTSASRAFASMFSKNTDKGDKTKTISTQTPFTKIKASKKSKRGETSDSSDLEISKKSRRKGKATTKQNDKKKKEEELPSKSSSDATSGTLNLTSVSLILFDEVDVVFEEDRGFLATVQHFMESTKIPIILTTTDPSFHTQLQTRHEHIQLHLPPLVTAASFLSTVCLAHGVRVKHQSIVNILRCLNGDVRRCLLELQYWCESGGGAIQVRECLNSSASPKLSTEEKIEAGLERETAEHQCKMITPVGKSDNENSRSSDSDFVSTKPPRKKAKCITSDAESSQEVITRLSHSTKPPTTAKTVQRSAAKIIARAEQIELSRCRDPTNQHPGNDGHRELPLVHAHLEESMLGLNDCSLSTTYFLNLIKAAAQDHQATERSLHACSTINQALNIDIIYEVALYCLPLPRIGLQPVQTHLPAKNKPALVGEIKSSRKSSRKRIFKGDWFESDCSEGETTNQTAILQENSGHLDQQTKLQNSIDPIATDSVKESSLTISSEVCNSNQGSTQDAAEIHSESHAATKSSNKPKISPVLIDFANFYDSISFIDSLDGNSTSLSAEVQARKLMPGMSEIETLSYSKPELENSLQNVGDCVNLMAARRFYKSFDMHVNSVKDHLTSQAHVGDTSGKLSGDSLPTSGECTDWPEEFHLPIPECAPDFWNITATNNTESQSLTRSVQKCLGPSVPRSGTSLQVDYLPYLREICRTESDRCASKSQRRFHHYLDYIGLNLKESTLAVLASTFGHQLSGANLS